MGVPIGEWGRHAHQWLWNFKEVGHAAGIWACIRKFDQACDLFIYLIVYFVVNCFLSIFLMLSTVEICYVK